MGELSLELGTPVSTDLLAILASAALPVGIILFFLVFRWRYLSVVRKTIYPSARLASESRERTEPESSSNPDPLILVWVDAESLAQEAHALERWTVAQEARALRTALTLSGAAFVLAAAAVVWHGQRMHFDARVAGTLVYFSTISGVAIVLAFVRPSWLHVGAIASAWVLTGVVFLVGVIGVRWALIPSLVSSGLVFGSMPLASVALLTLRRLRPLLVVFVPMVGLWLLTTGAIIGILEILGVTSHGLPSKSAVAIGVLNFVIGVGLAAYVLRGGHWRSFVTALVVMMAATGPFVTFNDLSPAWMIPAGIGVNAVAALVVGWLFLRFLRLKAGGRLPDEILHFSFCWIVLTAFLPILANSRLWPPWFILPLVAYGTVLAWLLSRRRLGSATAESPRRLLLLRVFDHTRRRRRLLDMLDDGWRWIGRVDLVVGVDFADRTLSPAALEQFALGRVHRHFISNEAESVERVRLLSNRRAVDGRYPLNELHCLPHIWPHVVTQLAGACDVALLDLRGLQRANQGALFELALMVERMALDRIVVLVDRRTDEIALSETAQAAWAHLADDSPNAGRTVTRLSLLRCSGSRADEAGITQALFLAAYRD
jgi:hypothetical protein